MTPFKFYDLFVTIVESFPIIPIIIGLIKWKRLPVGIKYFMGFLLTDLIINKIGDYYYYILHRNNLFLHYYYSLFQSTFILLSFYFFLKEKIEKKTLTILYIFCLFLLIIDFLFISKINYNHFSGPIINFIILSICVYYFSKNIFYENDNSKQIMVTSLNLSLVILLQFFVKFIDTFLEKYLLEAQNNAFLWLQIKDIYYYFMLLCLIMYSYIFYKIKFYET